MPAVFPGMNYPSITRHPSARSHVHSILFSEHTRKKSTFDKTDKKCNSTIYNIPEEKRRKVSIYIMYDVSFKSYIFNKKIFSPDLKWAPQTYKCLLLGDHKRLLSTEPSSLICALPIILSHAFLLWGFCGIMKNCAPGCDFALTLHSVTQQLLGMSKLHQPR